MKSCLFISCLFFNISSIGQKQTISINYKPSFTFVGKQPQSFQNYYFFSRKGNRTFNSSANILYTYRLSSKLSLATGLEYSQQGQNILFNADSVFPSNYRKVLRINLSYLRIPLIVNYSVLGVGGSEINIYSGISLGMAVGRQDNYQNIILEDILLPPAEKRYKNTDWAIPIGLNYKKELTSKIFANLGCEYLLGLTNAFSENGASKFGVLSEFDNSKQSRLSLNIGVGYSLTK